MALAAWVAALPANWQCQLVSNSSDREETAATLVPLTTRYCSEKFEALCALDAISILLSDDGALCVPSSEALQRAHLTASVLLTVPTLAPVADAYSPSQSARPDHYLVAPAIPGVHMRALWNGKTDALDRWIGHEIALRARQREVRVEFARPEGPCLPALRQIRGTDLIRTRTLATRILNALSNETTTPLPGISPANARAAMAISKTLPTQTAPVDSDPHRQEKAHIDRLLSSVTAALLPCHHNQIVPDVEKIKIRGKNVAIFKIESIGDCVLSLNFISRVIASEPARLTIVTTEEFASLLDDAIQHTTIVPLDRKWVTALAHPSPGEALDEILTHLRTPLAGAEIALFPRYFPDQSFARQLAMLLGIPVRAGIFNPRPEEGGYFNRLYELMLTHSLSVPDTLHESEKVARFGDHIGLPRLATTSLGLRRHLAVECPRERNLIAIGLGALGANRRWPAGRFIELLAALHEFDGKLRFALIGGTDVTEAAGCIQAALSFELINLVGRQSLRQTAELLCRCGLYIGNDSGAMHLAAAVGTPIVEISMHPEGAPTNHVNSPDRFGPVGVDFTVVRPPAPASDACANGCSSKHAHCINLVSHEDVYNIAKVMLSRANRGVPNEDR